MKIATKIAYNTIIQFISKVVSTALGLLAMAFVARYLGLAGFGEYTTAITFISFFAIMADLGLTLVTVQMISQPGADEKKILGNLLGLRLVSATILIGLAPITVLIFPYSNSVKMAVLAVSASFLFIHLNQIFVGLYQKHLRMDKVSLAEVLSRIAMVIGIILSIKNDFGLIGIMTVISLSSALNFLLHYLFSIPFVRIKLYFDFTYWREIIQKSWPLALTIIFNLIYLKADTLLLSIVDRPTDIGIIEEVGLYGAAYKVIEVLITFPFMFAGIVLPILTARWAEKNIDGFFEGLQKSFDAMIIFALPLVVGTYFVAEDIVRLVAGDEFLAAGPILQILIIAAAIIFPGTIFSHAIIAIGKQRKIISSYLLVAITALVGYLIFIPKYSYFGAAVVTIYSEAAIAFLMFIIVWKYTRFLPKLGIAFKSVLSSATMGAVIILLKQNGIDNLIIILCAAIFTYFISLYIFGVLKKKDIHLLLNKNNE